MLLLLGCAAPQEAPPDRPAPVDTADSGTPDDTDETGTIDTGLVTYACPLGMVGVPADSPAWCIDAYEVAVVDGAPVSEAGLLPAVGLTYEESAAVCAASAAIDATGTVYAMRHLATVEEWEDAGDGVVGDGGTAFPWGDAFDDARCVTLDTAGATQFDGLQPTGSMPGCVSAFGVYDQIGNAWEWTDSGVLLDADASIAALRDVGFFLVEDEAGLRLAGGPVEGMTLHAAGLQPPTVSADASGYLYATSDQVEPDPANFFARGYLGTGETPTLPVRLVRTPDTDGSPWIVHVAREYDGRPLPDKRGCAWYTGTNNACALTMASRTHLPDFDGTIGFRCVAPPYVE